MMDFSKNVKPAEESALGHAFATILCNVLWVGFPKVMPNPLGSTLGGPYSSKAQPLGVHPTPIITMLLGNSHVLNGVEHYLSNLMWSQ
jgi:hypothetical protein